MIVGNQDIDVRKIIETKYKIVNKQLQTIPFKFNKIQNKIYDDMSYYNLILKPRKKGCSSMIIAISDVLCSIVPHFKATLMSHEKKATERLFQKAEDYIKSLTENERPKMLTDNTQEFVFEDLQSRFFIGTAGQTAFGRGDDINILHISELPHWKNQDAITGVIESIPKGAYIFIESTANGDELFKEMFEKAMRGENNYKAHFFPWYYDDEYTEPLTESERKHFILTEKEELIRLEGKREYNIDVTLEHLKWRRNKIKDMAEPELFPQEYPSNPREAFLLAGRVYFDKAQLSYYRNQCEEPLKKGYLEIIQRDMVLHNDDNGIYHFWEMPIAGESYIIAPDTAEGIGGDWSVATVLRRSNKKFVATLMCQYDPAKFAKECYFLAVLYNYATLCPEFNNHGGTVINELIHLDYPENRMYKQTTINKITNEESENFGFKTTSVTKPIIIDLLAKYIRNGYLEIKDIRIINEMSNFIKDEKGKLHAGGKGHDDLVMSCAIANWINDNIQGEFSKSELSRAEEEWRMKTR